MPLFPRYSGPALMAEVCSVENLTQAWRRVRRNIQVARRGRSAGPDAVTLRDFEADWTRQMMVLADELRSGAYRPLPPRHVQIPKASGGARAIAILAVRDRIAQRAVQQVLEPLFDPLFLDCSYGCRPLIGVPEAVARVERYAQQGLQWVVDADIASYFDTIDQRILLGLVRQRIGDPALLQLIAQWLAVGVFQQDDALPPTPAENTLQRLGRAVRTAAPWSSSAALPIMPADLPPADPADPYAAALWERPGLNMPPGPAPLSQNSLEQHLWTAMMMAQPVLNGARHAWPYIRRFGGRRIALAGAVAAGALAAGEAVRRTAGSERRGTPQGGAISPLLANVYLHPFDLALTSQGMRLVRFVDDFVVMCATQAEAERALLLVQQQLAVLRLRLNDEKTQIVNYGDGLAFLGRALLPRARGVRLEQGLETFEEAQAALRKVAGKARRTKQ